VTAYGSSYCQLQALRFAYLLCFAEVDSCLPSFYRFCKKLRLKLRNTRFNENAQYCQAIGTNALKMKQVLVCVFLTTFACTATCVVSSELSTGIVRHKLQHSMDIRHTKSDSDVARIRRKRWDFTTFSVTEEQKPPQRLATVSNRQFCSCCREHSNASGFS